MKSNIRLADRTDYIAICDLLEEYFMEGTYGNYIDEPLDRQRAHKILFQLQHQGFIWLYSVDDAIVGMLAAVREPNVWFPKKIALREMFWYVLPEHRHTVGAARLFVAYQRQAEELLNSNSIDAYFMTEMATTAKLNLESRGFRLAERLYVKD
jgi:hypothetical protein